MWYNIGGRTDRKKYAFESEMKIMNNEVKEVIEKIKEVKDILKEFADKDEAIGYLINETKLSKEECAAAYDIIMKIKD